MRHYTNDVELRAVANRLLQDLGPDRFRFAIKALRPPTFEQLQKELTDAKEAGRPYHIVHFDGHGVYADLTDTTPSSWLSNLSSIALGAKNSGKHGYLLFEHSSEEKTRPVDGQTLGQLLHDNGVPILVLNACQSAMHEASEAPKTAADVHDEVRAIGSLAQAVVDQGVPGVLGMRYCVYVVTAAQYIGQLYSALAKGRGFGQSATDGRKHLYLNPDRWVRLQSKPLQDWFVPVAYEAAPIELLSGKQTVALSDGQELDPVQLNRTLLRYVPEEGFIGRDETILALDRAFDEHRVVLLHAYAGQGKSSTAVEFARWYSLTGGLGEQPIVLFASFEIHTDLKDLLNQIGQQFSEMLSAQRIDWSALNDSDKCRQLVLQLLRHVPVIWIWDNVEPVAGFPDGTESQWTTDGQNEIRDFLKQIKLDTASKVKILLTSRRDEQKWLGGIPYRISMRRMSDSDAAKFALKLGQERKLARAEIADCQPLLDYCAGNPLTLRVLVGQAVKAEWRGRKQVEDFVEAIRNGERLIEDADENNGRDKSLSASLDYGFRHAFKEDELPIIALLHLFQGTADVDVLEAMGRVGEHALPELNGKPKEELNGLLERAKNSGLLTHLQTTWFTIHPAVPWFLRQPFARHYDGQAGRSSAQSALHSWVLAVGELGNYYLNHFANGNQRVINCLVMEEANLLHARRLACRNQWLNCVISCMQGLRALYDYQGRTAEWARLVEEIIPDCCSTNNSPILGREDEYAIVMDYRVNLARKHEVDFAKAAALQEKLVAFNRRRAAPILALPAGLPLHEVQRNQLRTLAMSLVALGQILMETSNSECVQDYQEGISIFRRVFDKVSEAVAELSLGHAYMDFPAIRNLDAAEDAYQRSLDLLAPNDGLGRSRCILQIGMVHQNRFLDARAHKQPREVLLLHIQAAAKHYLQALALCPKDALTDLAPMHNALANLYAIDGQTDKAREHFELTAQYIEKSGDHLHAGKTRLNMALMYAQAGGRENQPSRQRDNLLRAQAYAEAALRDYKHYQGRAVKEETKAQDLLDLINQSLSKLPQ